MNGTSPIIKDRISGLNTELDTGIAKHYRQALWQGRVLKVMMLLTVASSVVAGVGGLFFHWSAEVVGLIALLPGISAFVAGTLRIQERVSRHARARDGLQGLKHRLLFELPENPTADHIASISREMRELREKTRKEVEGLTFNWNQFKDDRLGKKAE